ncbi:alpha/beta fold hydrolase [Williamsia sp. CHRR-6]|uniref:alpha/beta fold hydrolase n=1 Tax=Williamsia sp. CHRR-6 TaxID=2835871 RepID=UPI001BDA04C1|nr:alpha/beta hydrolase [Williamsia sp. CHRR-6]MBT0567636.1 alpha/beta hydrolase [Williamsia sp. CHRR-6]
MTSVVLLHGHLGLGFSWRYQVKALREHGFEVHAPDLPGHGTTPLPPGDLSWPALIDWLSTLLDEHAIDDAVLVGHDIGSALAVASARRHPERVSGLMLMSMPYLITPQPIPSVGRLLRDPGQAASVSAYLRESLITLCADTIPMSDAELAVFVNAYTATGFAEARAWLDLTVGHLDGPAELPTPAYFLDGEHDQGVALAGVQSMGAMRSVMPALRGVHTYDNAGHLFAQEFPRQMNAALLGFIRSL